MTDELKKTIDLKNEEIQNLDLQHKKDQDIIHQKSARILSLEQIEEQHHKLNRETMKENKQHNNTTSTLLEITPAGTPAPATHEARASPPLGLLLRRMLRDGGKY